jgi:hypothetical protein
VVHFIKLGKIMSIVNDNMVLGFLAKPPGPLEPTIQLKPVLG